MRTKLKLDLDELCVESFDTSARARSQRGTVRGNECCCCCCCRCCCSAGCTAQTECGQATCAGSCNGTCYEASCNGSCACGGGGGSGHSDCYGGCQYIF